MRKLWHVAKRQAVADMNLRRSAARRSMSSDVQDGLQGTKVNQILIQSLYEKTSGRGVSLSDPRAMSPVVQNYTPLQGKFLYTEIEKFVNAEDEEAAKAQGLSAKTGYKLMRTAGGALGSEQESSILVYHEILLGHLLGLQDTSYNEG